MHIATNLHSPNVGKRNTSRETPSVMARYSHAGGLQSGQADVALNGRLVHAEHGRPQEQRAEEQVPEVVSASGKQIVLVTLV